jgi:hypothetical protein
VRAAARVLLSLRRMRMSTSLGSALSRSVRGGRRGGGDLCLQPPREEEGAVGSQGAAVSEKRGGGSVFIVPTRAHCSLVG